MTTTTTPNHHQDMSIIAYECSYAYGTHARPGFHLIPNDAEEGSPVLAVLPPESTDEQLRAVAAMYGYASVVIDRLP